MNTVEFNFTVFLPSPFPCIGLNDRSLLREMRINLWVGNVSLLFVEDGRSCITVWYDTADMAFRKCIIFFSLPAKYIWFIPVKIRTTIKS